MESLERGALGLVRLVAACIIVVGLLDGGVYFTQYLIPYTAAERHAADPHRQSLDVLRIVLDSIPVVVGIVMLIKAKALANKVSDWIQ